MPAMTENDVETHESDESFNHQQTTEYGRFDVDATIDTDEQTGEVVVHLGLTKGEAESLWEQLQGDGHTYPEDARTAVLETLGYNVQGASCRT